MSRKLVIFAASILGVGLATTSLANTSGLIPSTSVITSKNNEPNLISLYITDSSYEHVISGFEKEYSNFQKAVAGDNQAAKSLINMADSLQSSYLDYLKGLILINGYGGIQKDETKGSLLVRQAAIDGVVPAQESLVEYFLVNNDSDGVKYWCNKLSYNSDSERCNYILGWMYENDQGIEQNQRIAFNYYRLAAAKNYPEALYKVGEYFFWGLGGQSRNPTVALEYLTNAIRLNSKNARVLYGFYKALYPNNSQEYVEGTKYLNDGIKEGNANALYFAAYISFKQNNQDAGFKYLYAAAAKQDVRANTLLGDLYFTGGSQDFPNLKVDIDYPKAMAFYENAAFYGNPNIQLHLGYVYFKGLPGVAVDYQKSINWLNRSAKNGNAYAYGLLATMYNDGVGVEVDKQKAVNYLQQACNLGYERTCSLKFTDSNDTSLLSAVEEEVSTYTPASTSLMTKENQNNSSKTNDEKAKD